jgi:hypothetical protein
LKCSAIARVCPFCSFDSSAAAPGSFKIVRLFGPYAYIDPVASTVVVVGHEASVATFGSSCFPTPAEPLESHALVVGHEEQPLSDVRRPDARSAKICVPDGVPRCFQVSVNKVEPRQRVLACNLLAKDDRRASLSDEVEPVRPEMPLIVKRQAFACLAERLAGATACPNSTIVRPPSATKRIAPHSDAGEEMALGVPLEV